jgi:hypothetical protein
MKDEVADRGLSVNIAEPITVASSGMSDEDEAHFSEEEEEEEEEEEIGIE